MTDSFIKPEFESRVFSLIIFLLPALALTTPFGIGIVEAIFLLGTIVYAKPLWRQRDPLFRQARWIVIAFGFNLMIGLVSWLWMGSALSSIDNPTRQLLAVAAIGLIVLTGPKAEWFWYGLFIGTIGAACIAVYQRFGLHMDRAGGFHQIIMFGDIVMSMGLMSLASIHYFAKTRVAALPYIAFSAGLTASILSGTRGGWVALVFSIIPLYSYSRHTVGRKVLVVVVLGAALLIAAGFIPESGISQRLVAVSGDLHQYRVGNPNTSVGVRLELWKASWKMFSEHPLLGVGSNNFIQGLNELIIRREINPVVGTFRHAHSEIFHALATNGMIGAIRLLLLYGAPLAFFLRSLQRKGCHQPYALAGLLLVLSFIDFGLTQVLSSHHVGTAFYALAVSVLAGLCVMTQQRVKP